MVASPLGITLASNEGEMDQENPSAHEDICPFIWERKPSTEDIDLQLTEQFWAL